ncbi:MAG: hypothetical protein KJZ65_14090 [Phycisphaerales bacterium]|nr:hypothetical protein [Phycisphaerales bacterium]
MNWNRRMSTKSSLSANHGRRQGRPLPISRVRAERDGRCVADGASEESDGTFRPEFEKARAAEPSVAWVADAPLLPGERGVHFASRIGIVAVETAGECDAVHGLRRCRQRLDSPACPCCPVNKRLNREGSQA